MTTCSIKNFQFNSIQEMFFTLKLNNMEVGINCLANRFYTLNGLIPLNWLNNTIETFKVKCKKLLSIYTYEF